MSEQITSVKGLANHDKSGAPFVLETTEVQLITYGPDDLPEWALEARAQNQARASNQGGQFRLSCKLKDGFELCISVPLTAVQAQMLAAIELVK
jgi:hypothetical protein